MQDIADCRIVVANIADQDRRVGQLMEMFPDARLIDRREVSSNSYRAVHIVPTIERTSISLRMTGALESS
jgi:ppGpp synthetase/RelA/SpoT-type nucleotidyltranferase